MTALAIGTTALGMNGTQWAWVIIIVAVCVAAILNTWARAFRDRGIAKHTRRLPWRYEGDEDDDDEPGADG